MMLQIFQKLWIHGEPLLRRNAYPFQLTKQIKNRVFWRIQNEELFLFQGTVKNSNDLATTLFIGPEELAFQLTHLVYSELKKIVPLGNAKSCQVDPLRLPDVDIIGVHARTSLLENFLEQGYLSLPYVNFSLDLTSSMAVILKRSSKRRRRDIRRIESYGYTYSISEENETDFDFFYRKMYLPYTTKRFGKAARLADYSIARSQCEKNGGVIFVKKGDNPVAGILFQRRGETIHALHSGVYEGDERLVTDLASQAALSFLIEWAESKGMKSLDYGSTLPFFSDGVFSYKKEWGMVVENSSNEFFCALKVNTNKGALSFLQQNPCIFADNGTISGAILVDHRPSIEELHMIFRKYYFAKLNSLNVIAYFEPKSSRGNEPDFLACDENSAAKPIRRICSSLKNHHFEVEMYVLNPKQIQPTPLSDPKVVSIGRLHQEDTLLTNSSKRNATT